MEVFLKTIAGAFITVVLSLSISKHGKDISLLLTVVVCCMIITAAFAYLDPVIEFFDKLQSVGKLDSGLITILFKAVGIGMLSEVASLICEDAGQAALGKSIKLLASAVIVWMSLPILTSLLDLIESILTTV